MLIFILRFVDSLQKWCDYVRVVLEGDLFLIPLESTDVLQNKSPNFLDIIWRFDRNPRSLISPANKLISTFMHSWGWLTYGSFELVARIHGEDSATTIWAPDCWTATNAATISPGLRTRILHKESSILVSLGWGGRCPAWFCPIPFLPQAIGPQF